MLCTRRGGLTSVSLDAPEKPTLIGTVSPDKAFHGNSIVLSGTRAFVLGDQRLAAYDITQPEHPSYLGTAQLEEDAWCACMLGDLLVAGVAGGMGGPDGVVVYDVSKPTEPRRLSLLKVAETPYALSAIDERRVVAFLDAPGSVLTGPGPHGQAVVIDCSEPSAPRELETTDRAGGRTGTVSVSEAGTFVVANGAVFRESESQLDRVFTFNSGPMLDGAVYHSFSGDGHVAIVCDELAVLLKLPTAKPR